MKTTRLSDGEHRPLPGSRRNRLPFRFADSQLNGTPIKPADKGQVALQQLIFTMNWEDPESDARALMVRPGDTLMTITSGGCNTLGFLVHDPAAVHTVDINPSQSYLLELKMASMKSLDYPEFIRFLGLAPSPDRLKAYESLRSHLSPMAAKFWDEHRQIVRKGFLGRGRYEYFVKLVGKLIRWIQGSERVDRLFDDRDLEAQREYYAQAWETRRTRWIFDLFFNKIVLARRGLKADYFHFDDGSNTFAESFFKKFRRVVHDLPIHGNYFLHYYLKGAYRSLAEVPEYLQERYFSLIKNRLGRICIHTGDAKNWLASMPSGMFDALALSNICELMSVVETRKMFQEVLRTGKPRARICFRNLILPREVPEDLQVSIRKDDALSRQIFNADRSFVYSKVAAYQVVK